MTRVQTVGTISEFMNPDLAKAKKEASKMMKKVKGFKDAKVSAALSTSIPLVLLGRGTFAHDNAVPVNTEVVEAVPVGAITGAIQEKVIHAFDPLIDLVIALSYPVAAVMLAAGSLFVMIGNKEKGLGMIQMAGMGYILVQLSPLMMKLLVEIGKTV